MTILKKQHPLLSLIRENILTVLFFLLVFLIFWVGLGNISASTDTEQLKATQQAVRRAAVQCYALEGAYPSDLAYLEEHYGLMIDHNRYVVHYQSLGSNLMPEIAVFRIEEESPFSNLAAEEV